MGILFGLFFVFEGQMKKKTAIIFIFKSGLEKLYSGPLMYFQIGQLLELHQCPRG